MYVFEEHEIFPSLAMNFPVGYYLFRLSILVSETTPVLHITVCGNVPEAFQVLLGCKGNLLDS